MVLDHDGYAKDQPIVVADDLSRVQFTLENRTGRAHETGLMLGGLPAGEYAVTVNGKAVGSVTGKPESARVAIPVGDAQNVQVSIARSR
jgi:hypothetical protein